MIDAFKSRYQRHFSGPLPIFIPEAVIQAVQPVQQDFNFEGYYAPTILFQDPYSANPKTKALGEPMIYHKLMYEKPFDLSCQWSGAMPITTEGSLNALCFITKNILAIVQETQSTIDWHNQYLILPLERDLPLVRPGQKIAISFDYAAGAPLSALRPVLSGPQ